MENGLENKLLKTYINSSPTAMLCVCKEDIYTHFYHMTGYNTLYKLLITRCK